MSEWAGPLVKPARGSGRVALQKRKQEQRVDANRQERFQKLEARRQEQDIRRHVYERDGARCRVCGEALTFGGDVTEVMHAHHIVYASAGGSDAPENRLSLCFECHRDEHEHRIRITGTGDCVQIERVNLETGKILDVWESAI